MAKVRMRDTTAHSELGGIPLRQGEVYEVSEELADHLVRSKLATKASANAETYEEKQAALVEEPVDDDNDLAQMNPDIARQVAEAGTREGDRAAADSVTREPLNAPTARRGGRSARSGEEGGEGL
jgi:hypothetical protein